MTEKLSNYDIQIKKYSTDHLPNYEISTQRHRLGFIECQSLGLPISTKPFFQTCKRFHKRSPKIKAPGDISHILSMQNSPEKMYLEKKFQTYSELYKIASKNYQKIWPFNEDNEIEQDLTENNNNNTNPVFFNEFFKGIYKESPSKMNKVNKFKTLNDFLNQMHQDQEKLENKSKFRRKSNYNEEELTNIKVGNLLEENVSHFPIEIRRAEPFRVLIAKSSKNLPKVKGFRTNSQVYFKSKTSQISSLLNGLQSSEIDYNKTNVENNNTNNGFKTFFTQNPQNETSQRYYHVEKIGYKNYKYSKPNDNSNQEEQARKTYSVSVFKKKDTLETCIKNLNDQKIAMESVINNEPNQSGFKTDITKSNILNNNNLLDEYSKKTNLKRNTQRFKSLDQLDSTSKNVKIEKKFGLNDFSLGSQEDQKLDSIKPELRNISKSISTLGTLPVIIIQKSPGKLKEIRQEFQQYVDITKKYIIEKKKEVLNCHNKNFVKLAYRLQNIEQVEGILLKIFKENNDILKSHNKVIVERILIGIGVDLSKRNYEMIKWDQFLRFKSIMIDKDATKDEILEFILKFFSLEKNKYIEKPELLRILRTLMKRLGERTLIQGMPVYDIVNNIIENLKKNDVLLDNTDIIDYNKLKTHYDSLKSDIHYMIELISHPIDSN